MASIEQLGHRNYENRRRARRALMSKGDAIVPDLILGLKNPDKRIRRGCAELMDHIADERCVAPLAEALEDPVADVRRNALHSLICDRCKTVPLGIDAVALVSKRALEDTSVRVRRRATTTLSLLPTSDERTYSILRKLIHDPDAEVRRRAKNGLLRLPRK